MNRTEPELDLSDRIDRRRVLIFTDGGCQPNPGSGGWAAIIQSEDGRREISGGARATTNNRMEIQALIEALKTLGAPCHVLWTTDSEYAISLVRHLQRGKRTKTDKPNQDLLAELQRELIKGHLVECQWIRGHQGHPENERCDELAEKARISG